MSGVARPSSSGPGPPSVSCQDVPVTLVGKEHPVLGSPGCPFVHRQRWGAVVLATGPFPLEQSLEVRSGGTWDLGVPAREGLLSPRTAKEHPPQPPCPLRAHMSWTWGRPGHPLGIGMPEVAAAGGRTFPAGQAPWWQLPGPACPMSPELEAAAGAVAWVPGGWGGVILGVGAKEREKHLPPGQEVGRSQLCSPVGPPVPVGTTGHRTGSVPNARLCGLLNLGPRGEAADGGRRGGGRSPAAIVRQNLPEAPSCGDNSIWGG